jgi:uncharacterized protein DUF4230
MAEDSLPPAPPSASPGPRSHWPLAVATVAVSLIALAAFVFKSCLGQPAELANSLARAAQPQISITTIIQTSLDRLRDESKLVVYTANVSVMITKTSEKKLLFGKLDLGSTTVRLRASGNKAQIIVPLKKLAAADFHFDEAQKRLTVTIPPPRVDEGLVEVQTDPEYYEVETDLGWARLNTFSGDFLREQARRDLRPAVIAEASQPRIIEMAKENAREKVSALLQPALTALAPEAKVSVEFKK